MLGLAAVAIPSPARADERGRVELKTAGTEEVARSLEPVVRELLARLGVTLEIARIESVDVGSVMTPAAGAPAVARIWIDLRGETVVVHVVDGSWTRLLTRRVPVTGAFDEVEREEIAHILEAAVEALLAGEEIGELWHPEPAPAPEPPSPPLQVAAPTRARPRPALDARYEVRLFDRDELLHGPALASRIEWPCCGPLLLSSGASLGAILPASLVTPEVSIDLAGLAFRLAWAAGVGLSRGTSLALELGGGVDLLHDTPRAPTAGAVTADPAQWTVLAMARAAIRFAVRLAGPVEAAVLAGLDVDLTDLRFVVRSDGGTRAVLDPPRAQPFAALGVGVAIDP